MGAPAVTLKLHPPAPFALLCVSCFNQGTHYHSAGYIIDPGPPITITFQCRTCGAHWNPPLENPDGR